MKTATTLLAFIALASSALAHTAAAPHSHNGSQVSWMPAVACLAALATVLYVVGRFRNNRKSR